VARRGMAFRIHQTSLVAAFPKRAGAMVSCVDLADVPSPTDCIMRDTFPTALGVTSRWTWLVIST
jgi:hypothetical protein